MSENRLPDYLDHMAQATQDACSFVDGLSKGDFLADRRTQQAVIMSLIINGMNLLSIDSYWHQFVIGAIVIISVWVDQLRAMKFQAA